MKVKSLSRIRLLATPWTAAYQAPQSMGFPRQEYWSGVPLPSPYLYLSKNYLSFLLEQVSPSLSLSLSLSLTHTHTHTHTHTLVWLMGGSQHAKMQSAQDDLGLREKLKLPWYFHSCRICLLVPKMLNEVETTKRSLKIAVVLHLLSLQPHGLQHTRLPCPSPSTGACSNSCPSSR